jgi:hypothetical protein
MIVIGPYRRAIVASDAASFAQVPVKVAGRINQSTAITNLKR